jgi:hypothetical protein
MPEHEDGVLARTLRIEAARGAGQELIDAAQANRRHANAQ